MEIAEERRTSDRRITDLELNYKMICSRLDGLDAIRNQIVGMVALVKFLGWGGIIAISVFVLNLIFGKHP